jgi:hypothetical protein
MNDPNLTGARWLAYELGKLILIGIISAGLAVFCWAMIETLGYAKRQGLTAEPRSTQR